MQIVSIIFFYFSEKTGFDICCKMSRYLLQIVSNPVFSEKYHQFVMCQISQESGKG